MSESDSGSRKPKSFTAVWAAVWLLAVCGLVAAVIWRHDLGSRLTALTGHRSGHLTKGASTVDFAHDVAPILNENCLKCHGPEKQKGSIRFDMKDAVLKPGDSGEAAIVPGDAAKSALLRRITSKDPDEQMPPKGDRLPTASVATLQRWIAEGAPWSDSGATTTAATTAPAKSKHWAFQRLASVTVPSVRQAAWTVTPIDRLILAAQEAQGLQPNAEAPRRVLIRRLYFDLIGLPPSPQEIDDFERSVSPTAYEELVDRLLADPRYGERWGRHWLDVARYADTNGYEEDRSRPYAYTYRDFVIRALNSDLPYDRFIQWQIAGDLLEPRNMEAMAATGFIAAAPNVRPEFINFRKKDRCDELDNVVSTTGSAILGLTIGCARCHDHKFDPIPTADYYHLTAFFTSTDRVERAIDPEQGKAFDRAMAQFDEKQLDKLKAEERDWRDKKRDGIRHQRIDALPITDAQKALLKAPVDEGNLEQDKLLKRFAVELGIPDRVLRTLLSKADQEKWDAMNKAEDEILARRPEPIPRMLSIKDGRTKKTYLLVRGNPEQEGQEMKPEVLSIFPQSGAWSFVRSVFHWQHTRADLARWLTSVDNGAGALTARVEVNRLWQHHFGRGLVDTPGDFGVRGDAPTNPQLLDWLAAELIRGGWKVKPLQKMIVMSAVYRQGTTSDAGRAAIDPANRLWWRREPQRMEAEVLRDSILAVSGDLNPKMFGPPVKPRMSAEAISITNPKKNYDAWPANVVSGPETWRRSIYVFTKRSNLFPFLQTFDASDAIASCTRRNPTTVAPQALALLNDPFVREEARAFAKRLIPLDSTETRVRSAFQLALGRAPSADEESSAAAYIREERRECREHEDRDAAKLDALADFCQGLMALNEFCYID